MNARTFQGLAAVLFLDIVSNNCGEAKTAKCEGDETLAAFAKGRYGEACPAIVSTACIFVDSCGQAWAVKGCMVGGHLCWDGDQPILGHRVQK